MKSRMVKFHLDVFCGARSRRQNEVHGKMVVLRNDKVCYDGSHIHPYDLFLFLRCMIAATDRSWCT